MTLGTLIFRYTLFAVLATLANLATQRLILLGGDGWLFLSLAIGAGTIVGLVIKFLLDKRWVFYDRSTGIEAAGGRFALYASTGVVTTLIFWGMEIAFWLIWQSDLMREVGAVIGLSIGYVTKFRLDRSFVFNVERTKPGFSS